MKNLNSILLLLVLNIYSFANLFAQNLSENAEISIITCAPGDELYSTFGHSAVRVKDLTKKIDKVYNYGTFDFQTPNFYLKFAKGQLDYMLSVVPYKYFIISYMNENRWIKEQILNLSELQKHRIYSYLEKNALPENKYYRYDFFFDNCATRVKDVIKNALGEDLIFPQEITENNETFRDLLKPYLKGKNWERFGINLALGQPADKIVRVEEATFLPDYLVAVFSSSQVIKNNLKEPVVKESKMLFDPIKVKPLKNTFFTPLVTFSIILLIVIILTLIELIQKKHYLFLDKLIFFIFGFVGFAVLLLWFGTEHKAVVNNQNILWASPLLLIASFLLKKTGNRLFLRQFFIITAIISVICLVINLFFINLFDFAVNPLLIIIIMRSLLIYFKY